MEMKLIDIENKFNFKYPPLYKQLEKDNMLTLGEYNADWYANVFPKLKDVPPLLLHSYDFEIFNSIEEINEILEELRDSEDYRKIDPKFTFIPFAHNGGGDYYCFFPTEQIGDDIPIVILYHDDLEAEYLAKNLQDYIFKTLLTDMSDRDGSYALTDDEFKSNLLSALKTHGRYLSEKQNTILKNILEREIIDYDMDTMDPNRGFLTDVEVEEILEEVIPYEKMGETFEYSLD